MLTLKKNTAIIIFLVFSNLIVINSCSERTETVSCFPNTQISIQINTNLPLYQKLQYTGGWVYINEVGAGTRGLIVIKTNNGFKVYDRNAPHICPDNNTTLEVKDETKILCPKDGAEWILLTGQPLESGTAMSKVPPKTYPYNYDATSGNLSVFY